MNICYVLSTSEISHGSNKSFFELLSAIDQDKYNIFVLIRRHGTVESLLREYNVSYRIIPYINDTKKKIFILNWIKWIINIVTKSEIKKYFLKNEINLVHNNSLPELVAMDVAEKQGIPYVCHIRENVKEGLNEEFLFPKRHFEVMKRANAIIAISSYVAEYYHKQLNTDNFCVIPDGLNVDTYFEKKEILDKKRKKISMYGSFHEQKGQLIAVKAAYELVRRGVTDFELYLVGDNKGSYAEKVAAFIQQNDLKCVKFTGLIKDNNTLRNFRRDDDLNLICSYAEGLGRTTIESMLAGSLTVASASGATTEIITDGETGVLFTLGDYKELADKISDVFDNPEKYREIAKKGQTLAKNRYDLNTYVKKIESIYDNIQ